MAGFVAAGESRRRRAAELSRPHGAALAAGAFMLKLARDNGFELDDEGAPADETLDIALALLGR